MTTLTLSGQSAEAAAAALYGDVSDPVALMKSAGCRVSIFFEYGTWHGVDFRQSDLTGVSFRGADMSGAIVTQRQLDQIASTNPRLLPTMPNVREKADTSTREFAHDGSPSDQVGSGEMGSAAGNDLPRDRIGEQAVLGTILMNNDAYYRVSDFLKPEHFFYGEHQKIYSLQSDLVRMGKLASPDTLESFVPADIHPSGQSSLLFAELLRNAISVAEVEGVGRRLQELAMRRDLIGQAENIRNLASNIQSGIGFKQQLELAERELFRLSEQRLGHSEGLQNLQGALAMVLDKAASGIERRSTDTSEFIHGFSCGVRGVDDLIGSFFRSEVAVFAGSSRHVLTGLATTMAVNVARDLSLVRAGSDRADEPQKGAVAYFSLNKSEEDLALNMLAFETGLRPELIRTGYLSEHQFERIVQASQQKTRFPLFIDSSLDLTIFKVQHRCRELAQKNGLSLVIIDNLQQIFDVSAGTSGLPADLTKAFRAIKRLARELGVSIIVLSDIPADVVPAREGRTELGTLQLDSVIEEADFVAFLLQEKGSIAEDGEAIDQHELFGSVKRGLYDRKVRQPRANMRLISRKGRRSDLRSTQLCYDPEFEMFWNDVEDDIDDVPF